MKRLLLVDDDPLITRSYCNRLSAHGFQVNTAPDGTSAITILRSAKPDLVVLDLMMPNVSGVDVLKFIRSDRRLAATPVIVLTNAFLNDLGREAAALGIEKALLKADCSPSVLMAAIDELLHARKAPTGTSSSADSSAAPADAARAQPPPTAQPTQQDVLSAPQPTPAQSPPAAPATHAEVSKSRTDEESKSGAGDELQVNGPTICGDLRQLLQAFSRVPQAATEQGQRLQALYRRAHSLTAAVSQTGYWQLKQVASAFEALLYVLIEKPARLNPSVQRTLANLVDFVEVLFQRAEELRLILPRSPQVLAVDDDAMSNVLVVWALRRASIQASSTEDPFVALQRLEQQHYDLVLLDVEMPKLSGFELCKRLRTLPGYEKTPVIYVTSHSDFETRTKSTLSGGDDLLAKPVLPMELLAKVVMHSLKSQLPA